MSSAKSLMNIDNKSLLALTVKQISGALTVKQISGASSDVIGGVFVPNVKLVGFLFHKDEKRMDSKTTFVLYDGTGRIDCVKWIDDAADSKQMELLSNNMYVKVHGKLVMVSEKKEVMVNIVRPLVDYDEITNHFAACIHVHIHCTKKQKMKHTPQITGQMSNAAVSTTSKKRKHTLQDTGQMSNAAVSSPSQVFLKLSADRKLYDCAKERILQFVKQQTELGQHPEGVHRDLIAVKVDLPLPTTKINEAIEQLRLRGLIYQMKDEFHYLYTPDE